MINKQDFKSFMEDERFTRVGMDGPLNLFYGVSNGYKPTLLLLTQYRPENLKSTRSIDVTLTCKEENGKSIWNLSFTLINRDFLDIFLDFCNDIIESSQKMGSEQKAVLFFQQRYESWRQMLTTGPSEYLSDIQIQGLIGEMTFLLNYMIPHYGVEKAVLSWIGPRMTPQDFVVDTTWYEIKTISSRSENVMISSLEQLDSVNEGNLVIFRVDKTSLTDKEGTNLNMLYHRLMKALEQYPDLRTEQRLYLKRMGYTEAKYYEEYVYHIRSCDRYQVNAAFPALRRRCVESAIVKANYEISIPAIESFKK